MGFQDSDVLRDGRGGVLLIAGDHDDADALCEIFWISSEEKIRIFVKKSKFCDRREQNFDFLTKVQNFSSLEIQKIEKSKKSMSENPNWKSEIGHSKP